MSKPKITIVTPQFDRTEDMPAAPAIPSNDEEWRQLKSMTAKEATERGFLTWDGGLFLFPKKWFDRIPGWLKVECIDGSVSKWSFEKRDNDTRFGCLAYGIRAKEE